MVSESELPTTQSNEVMERKMRLQTARQITNLIVSLTTLSKVQKQIDVTNNTLVALQMQMIENTEATVRFISEVNLGASAPQQPKIRGLNEILKHGIDHSL